MNGLPPQFWGASNLNWMGSQRMDPARAVTDQVMVVISQAIAVISHVAVQKILREGPKEQEGHQRTHHLIQGTVNLQNHVADR